MATNERNAGRKPKTDKKVHVGGRMTPEMANWVRENGGFRTVEKIVGEYMATTSDQAIIDSIIENLTR